ncbi:MAG TPA: [FeFe] hydrogenase H-cluster radical SAM maturase HydE [Vicinamibacterales bacterium]|nr:[FeFe] hydrogenase H-cluster radical SAM maturase HydE [Vicinamibacterales bacterium]HPW19748.1 [FeFe] hydrogenase H-cluster radical SAM maturase HydE [Vicinamibacterales bacterium]
MPLSCDALDHDAIAAWLRETDPAALAALWRRADAVRRARVGDAVHLRGLIEITNYCVRHCAYCGIAACAGPLRRYRMTLEEILACARQGRDFGFGTVVLQGGEDPGVTGPFVADVVRAIKAETGVAVTLSLGERSEADLRLWRDAGADRYLLRFETTDQDLYARIHPNVPGTLSDRFAQLRLMRRMGYEIGTGVMIGIPGQTWDTLADDILAFRDFDMDMIGIGPYLRSPRTPLAGPLGLELAAAPEEQVPSDEVTTLKAMALTRLVCPDTNIPSTTALSILDPSAGRVNGLTRGANVIMPNLTPPEYRVLYDIYPGKAGIHETAEVLADRVIALIDGLGRTIGTGPGSRGRV